MRNWEGSTLAADIRTVYSVSVLSTGTRMLSLQNQLLTLWSKFGNCKIYFNHASRQVKFCWKFVYKSASAIFHTVLPKVALSCVTRAERLIQVSGYEGREVNVSCPYGNGYQSHEKYLCRNPCGYKDVLISTKGTKTNKYSIHDHKSRQVFTTTVSNLRLTDAGKYWCGVTRDGLDIYTEVKLEVEKGE